MLPALYLNYASLMLHLFVTYYLFIKWILAIPTYLYQKYVFIYIESATIY